jgi:hypothetical protein
LISKPEAEEALRQAIMQHAQVFDIDYPNSMLSEFAIIACWTPIEETGQSEYSVAYHAEDVPEHVALGLFTLACDIAIGNDEEEEE